MYIERIRTLSGFVNWAVMYNDLELARFDRYYDAVAFIREME